MSDRVTRALEKRVLSGDLTAVPALARAYERGGKPLSVWVFTIQTRNYDGVYVFSSEEKAYDYIGDYLKDLVTHENLDSNIVAAVLLSVEANDAAQALDIIQDWASEHMYGWSASLIQTCLDPDMD